MATLKQIDANRQNARRSSGPRTPEGKAASRFNALKSGIDAQAEVIPSEDPAQLETLLAEYRERLDTSPPERRMLVDTLVTCDWLLRRLSRAESSLWFYLAKRTDSESDMFPEVTEGRILYHGDKVFDRLQRRLNSTYRNYDRALKQLQDLGAATAPATEDAQPQSNQPPTPEIGFVPQIMQILVGQALPPALPPANPGDMPGPAGSVPTGNDD